MEKNKKFSIWFIVGGVLFIICGLLLAILPSALTPKYVLHYKNEKQLITDWNSKEIYNYCYDLVDVKQSLDENNKKLKIDLTEVFNDNKVVETEKIIYKFQLIFDQSTEFPIESIYSPNLTISSGNTTAKNVYPNLTGKEIIFTDFKGKFDDKNITIDVVESAFMQNASGEKSYLPFELLDCKLWFFIER